MCIYMCIYACMHACVCTGKYVFGESMQDNLHLLIMEKCLEKQFPQQLLRKAWQKVDIFYFIF